MNPYALLGMLAAGVGIAWAVTRSGEAQAASSRPMWQWAATNVTQELGGGLVVTGEIWEVWIEEPGKAAYTLGGAAATEFATYAQAKAAAIAYITSRGATPLEKEV